MNRIFYTFPLPADTDFRSSLLYWAQDNFEYAAFLDSNRHTADPYSNNRSLLAVGVHAQICPGDDNPAFDQLKAFSQQHNDWLFGFLSYDLKNQLEELTSSNFDGIKMPLLHFFLPEILFIIREQEVDIGILVKPGETKCSYAKELLLEIRKHIPLNRPLKTGSVLHRVSRDEYIKRVKQIQHHIQKGDIYETNYCIEFYSDNTRINPIETWLKMSISNPSPFSCYYRFKNKYLISGSPERFMAKRGSKLVSQPIKGTIRRGTSSEEDEALKKQLFNDPKERSENVMIVDLVRNDLSQSATPGSVIVEELCGIYSYPRVHQMISTVTCKLKPDVHPIDAIRKAFPMGSMTGAPKIRAMQIAEECEATRRGLYSGAVGYISPEKDFDFNVIIRSILYNADDGFLSFMAGSAITIDAIPEKEYEECLLKASSMAQIISTT